MATTSTDVWGDCTYPGCPWQVTRDGDAWLHAYPDEAETPDHPGQGKEQA